MTRNTRTALIAKLLAALVSAGGCHLIIGLDEFVDAPVGTGGAGGATVTGAGGGAGGAGTAGGGGGPASGDVVWARIFGDENSQTPVGLVADTQGNIFVVGNFGGTLVLDDQTLIGAGVEDVFLVKLDPHGNVLWAKQFGDAARQTAGGVAVDAAGNVVIVGSFQGTISFGGQAFQNQGSSNGFVAKLDGSGTHVWSKHLTGPGIVEPRAAKLDSQSGDVVVGGSFSDTLSFGDGTLSSTGVSDRDAFVAKLSASSGSSLWHRDYGDDKLQQIVSVAIDSAGNIAVGGAFRGVFSMGSAQLSNPTVSDDGFIARMDPLGNVSWARTLQSGSGSSISQVTIDALGAVIFVGSSSGVVDLGCEALVNDAGSDALVAKLLSTGDCSWSKAFSSAGDAFGTNLAMVEEGHLVLAASFDQSLDVDGATLNGDGSYDFAMIKLSPEGGVTWASAYGGAGGDVVRGLAGYQGSSGILLTGFTSESIDFGAIQLMSAGGVDTFVAKLVP